MRAFSDRLYYWKSPQDRYQRSWQRECGYYECLPDLWKESGSDHPAGRLKCVLAIVIVRMVYGNSMNGILPLLTLYAALGCILGHNFPISMEFRGGKGIAASVGMIIAFDWRIFIVCAVVFFALFFTTHYVSLCSLSAYAVAFILVLVFGHMGKYGMDQAHTVELYIVMAVLTAMAFYRHRANIVRLFHGTENKVFLSSKNKK